MIRAFVIALACLGLAFHDALAAAWCACPPAVTTTGTPPHVSGAASSAPSAPGIAPADDPASPACWCAHAHPHELKRRDAGVDLAPPAPVTLAAFASPAPPTTPVGPRAPPALRTSAHALVRTVVLRT